LRHSSVRAMRDHGSRSPSKLESCWRNITHRYSLGERQARGRKQSDDPKVD
jgi:hypothetical protein